MSEYEESDCGKDVFKRYSKMSLTTRMILIKILHAKVFGLHDTRAEITICSEDSWKRVSRIVSRPQIMPRKDITLINFSGTRKMGVKSEVILLLVIGGIFLAVRGLKHDGNLGKDLRTEIL